LFIFFGNGEGSSSLANVFLFGDRPRSVKVGDVKSDGCNDLVLCASAQALKNEGGQEPKNPLQL
jgi:hypothetical protein